MAKYLILLCAMAFSSSLLVAQTAESKAAHLRHASSFKKLAPVFRSLDKHSIVVFDVDRVLLTHEDAIGHPAAQSYCTKLIHELQKHHGKNFKKYWSQYLLQAKQRPVEKYILSKIKSLKKRGVRVIACTAMSTESYGDIHRRDVYRFRQLKRAGYDLSFSFPKYPRLYIRMKEGKRLFKDGVIFAGGVPKGKTLKAFFKQVHFKPNKVLFFDDVVSNVRSVRSVMKDWGVEVISVRYDGAAHQPLTIHKRAMKKQRRNFVKRGTWLNDSKARRL